VKGLQQLVHFAFIAARILGNSVEVAALNWRWETRSGAGIIKKGAVSATPRGGAQTAPGIVSRVRLSREAPKAVELLLSSFCVVGLKPAHHLLLVELGTHVQHGVRKTVHDFGYRVRV
jgi:hypothetical protein